MKPLFYPKKIASEVSNMLMHPKLSTFSFFMWWKRANQSRDFWIETEAEMIRVHVVPREALFDPSSWNTSLPGFLKSEMASEIQSLALTLWTLWKNKMNTENDQHRLIDFFLKFNVEIDTVLNDFHPRYGFLAVPLQEAKQLYSRGMQMAQIHCQLMTFYKGIKLFNLTSKTHFVLHSLFNARWLHPSLVWCYKGEDQMQRVAKLWKSCLLPTGRQPRGLLGRNAICFFCVTKLGEEKRRLCPEFYPTCVNSLTITALPSLLV